MLIRLAFHLHHRHHRRTLAYWLFGGWMIETMWWLLLFAALLCVLAYLALWPLLRGAAHVLMLGAMAAMTRVNRRRLIEPAGKHRKN